MTSSGSRDHVALWLSPSDPLPVEEYERFVQSDLNFIYLVRSIPADLVLFPSLDTFCIIPCEGPLLVSPGRQSLVDAPFYERYPRIGQLLARHAKPKKACLQPTRKIDEELNPARQGGFNDPFRGAGTIDPGPQVLFAGGHLPEIVIFHDHHRWMFVTPCLRTLNRVELQCHQMTLGGEPQNQPRQRAIQLCEIVYRPESRLSLEDEDGRLATKWEFAICNQWHPEEDLQADRAYTIGHVLDTLQISLDKVLRARSGTERAKHSTARLSVISRDEVTQSTGECPACSRIMSCNHAVLNAETPMMGV